MDLTEYYAEVVKTAGLVGPSEDDVKEALAALDLAKQGHDVDLDAVEEVLKTAGLLEEETELSEEKIAACNAVYEQFDIDGISFDSDEEKQAAAFAIVDGFEKVAEGERGVIGKAWDKAKHYGKTVKDKTIELAKKIDKIHGTNENKTLGLSGKNWRRVGSAAAATGLVGGAAYLMRHKNKNKNKHKR